MFVVKDEAKFAVDVIPQYFDRRKCGSFVRQLKGYGFRKGPTNAVRNADFDESTTNHRIFIRKGHFKPDAKELCKIKRLIDPSAQKQEHKVAYLEGEVMSLTGKMKVVEDKYLLIGNKILALEQRLKLDLSQRVQNMEDKVELDQSSSMTVPRASALSSAVLEQLNRNVNILRKKAADDSNSVQTHNKTFPNLLPLSNVTEVFSRESEPSYISELSSTTTPEPSSLPTLSIKTDIKLIVRQDVVDAQEEQCGVESHTNTNNGPRPGNQPPMSTPTNETDEFLDLGTSFSLSRASSTIDAQTWDLVDTSELGLAESLS